MHSYDRLYNVVIPHHGLEALEVKLAILVQPLAVLCTHPRVECQDTERDTAVSALAEVQ